MLDLGVTIVLITTYKDHEASFTFGPLSNIVCDRPITSAL